MRQLLTVLATAGLATLQLSSRALPVPGEPDLRLRSTMARLVESSNRFAFVLHAQLSNSGTDDNLFYSPYSLYAALLIAMEGASGKSALEMGTVLQFSPEYGGGPSIQPWDTSTMHDEMNRLGRWITEASGNEVDDATHQKIDVLESEYDTLTSEVEAIKRDLRFDDEDYIERLREQRQRELRIDAIVPELNSLRQQVDRYEIRLANALWVDRSFRLRDHYRNTLERFYGIGPQLADFQRNPDAERAGINAWVQRATRDRVKNLLPEGTVDALTRIVIANAIYFQGRWQFDFDERRTEPAAFTCADGSERTVHMMTRHHFECRYAELSREGNRIEPVFDETQRTWNLPPNPDGWQIVELPYRGDAVTMTIVLPRRHDNIGGLEQIIDNEQMSMWLDRLAKQRVTVFLPKFKIETSYGLNQTLASMGMRAAFERGGFTMMGHPPQSQELFISAVVHKAFVEVDEKGTEAAAATGLSMRVTGVPARRPPPAVFRADRPFLFFIRHRESGAILFVGRVSSPEGV